MTRINVIPVEQLTDQHLLAEAREITRIPSVIIKGKANVNKKLPDDYTLGQGHVSFFYNKLGWLENRYRELLAECARRGFNVTDRWTYGYPKSLSGEYKVTENARKINMERILLRFPKKARYFGQAIEKSSFYPKEI